MCFYQLYKSLCLVENAIWENRVVNGCYREETTTDSIPWLVWPTVESFISSSKKDRPLYLLLAPISFSISYLLHLQMNELLCRGVCNFTLPLHSLPATEGAHLDSHIRNTGCSMLGYILYILLKSEFDVKPFLYLTMEWDLKGQDLKWLHIFFNN